MAQDLTKGEVLSVVNGYIGVAGGYLGDFSYRTHSEFYPEYCGLEIDPDELVGTTRERFIKILSAASPSDQAKILRGVIKRFPADSNKTRQAALPKMEALITRLESTGPVPQPKPKITSGVVERALDDAAALLRSTGAASGIDRVHTALHGYLIAVCDEARIPYSEDPSITDLYKLLREKHPSLKPTGVRAADISLLLKSMATVVDVLNPIRNRGSLAHPNRELLDVPEAWLVINTTRTLLHYLDMRIGSG